MYDYHQVTRVAPENASHEYQLSHHECDSIQRSCFESHEWWESWYECDAFSGATRVEPGGNHITTVAFVAVITVHNECCIGFFIYFFFGVKFGKLQYRRSAMAIWRWLHTLALVATKVGRNSLHWKSAYIYSPNICAGKGHTFAAFESNTTTLTIVLVFGTNWAQTGTFGVSMSLVDPWHHCRQLYDNVRWNLRLAWRCWLD